MISKPWPASRLRADPLILTSLAAVAWQPLVRASGAARRTRPLERVMGVARRSIPSRTPEVTQDCRIAGCNAESSEREAPSWI